MSNKDFSFQIQWWLLTEVLMFDMKTSPILQEVLSADFSKAVKCQWSLMDSKIERMVANTWWRICLTLKIATWLPEIALESRSFSSSKFLLHNFGFILWNSYHQIITNLVPHFAIFYSHQTACHHIYLFMLLHMLVTYHRINIFFQRYL